MTKQEGILKWSKCLDIIKDNLDEAQYQACFAPIVAYDFKGNDLYLQVPSMFFIEQIESNYLDLLRKTIIIVSGVGYTCKNLSGFCVCHYE